MIAMNKRENTGKLVAAFAILAMVMCVFAVVPMGSSDAADGTITISSEDTGIGIVVNSGDDIAGEFDGNKAVLNGVANGKTSSDNDTDFNTWFTGAQGSWAYMYLTGIDKWAGEDTKVQIIQTNSALKYAWEVTADDIKDGVKTKSYASADLDTYYFLVPKDGSSVTFEITVGTEKDGKFVAGDKTVTVTVDFSKVSTKVTLADNLSGEGWAYTSAEGLKLTNYSGNETFYFNGALTVTFDGKNTINAYGGVAVQSTTSLTIKGTDADSSLAVEQNDADGFGIQAYTITIGDSSGAVSDVSVTGGNRAVYTTASGGLNINNATLYAEASEKAIRVGGGASNTTSMTVVKSDVTAVISGTGSTNGQGNDDIFGIKTGKISIDADSSVKTDGLRVEASESQFTNAGNLVVYGNYTQNASAELKAIVAGIYFDAFIENVTIDTTESDATGNHLVDGGAYGVNVDGVSTTETITGDADAAAKSIANAITKVENQMVVLDVSSNSNVTKIALDDLNGNDIVIVGSDSLKDVAVTIDQNESVTISGISSAKLDFTNGTTNKGTVTDFTGTIIVSQGSLDYQIIEGSGTFDVAGESGFTGTVTGDTKISGSGNAVLKDLDIQSGTLTLGKDIAFTIEGTLTNAGTITGGATIDITSGNYVSEAGTITATVAHSKNTMQMDGVKGTYTLQRGSVAIAGEGVTFEEGKITISGQAKLLANVTVSSGVTVTINEGATLTTGAFKLDVSAATTVNNGTIVVSDKGELAVGAGFTNEEAITVYGKVTGTNNANGTNNGTITVLDKGKIDGTFSGTGIVDLSQSSTSSTGGLSGQYGTEAEQEKDYNYPADQNLVVRDNTTLAYDVSMTISGNLSIPEGMTLTIKDTALLTLSGQSAILVNNGTIVIQATGNTDGLALTSGARIVNNGTITVEYTPKDTTDATIPQTLRIGNDTTVVNNGTITVGEKADIKIDGVIENAAEAVIDFNGTVTGGTIYNAGTVNVNGKVPSSLTISNSAIGAVVNIESLNGTVKVNDDKITGKDYSNAGNNAVNLYGSENYTVGNIVITSATYDVGTGKDAKTYKTLDVSGESTVTYIGTLATGQTPVYKAANASMRLIGDITVSDTFSFGPGMKFIFQDADVKVSGTMTISGSIVSTTVNNQTVEATIGVTAESASKLTVTGTVTSSIDLDIQNMELNAAAYKLNSGTEAVPVYTYYYTTLEKAIASGSKAVTVYGDIEVSADITIPAEVVVTQDEGSEITVGEDATVTVEDKGAIANGNVVVEGTLYVANAATGFKDGVAISEVYSSNGTDARYTNLKTAMAAAQSGDTVTLNNAEGCEGVTLELTSFTIKDGVTLDTNGMAFKVIGTTLTIDGTLLITDVTKYEFKDADNGVESSIVLNGYIKSQDNMAFDDGRFPAGAYYSVDEKGTTYNYITTVANAAQVIDDVDSDTVRIHGAVSVGEVAFASEATDGAYVYIESDATVTGTISIDNVTLTVNGKIAGSVTDAAKSGTFTTDSKAEYGNVSFAVTEKGLAVTGAPSKATITGTVYLAGYSNSSAELVVDGTAVTDGAVTIGTLTVNGDVVVSAGNTMTVTTAYVYGGLSTESTDADGVGTANIATMYAGIDSKMASADAATVEGNVVLKSSNGQAVAYVSAASAVPESFADATKYVSTQFVVDGAEWITVYGTTGAEVDYIKAPIENAKFIGWATEEGKDATITSGKIALGGENDILYADIDRNVYTIKVIADDGIGTVSLDGRIFNAAGNQFTLSEVAAGTYELDFVLKSGFEGSPTMTVEGQTTTGYTFTVSGDFGDEENGDILIYLSGTTPVTSGGEIVVNTGSDDMSLTDILLIVLVVLIVIMAVIVALRLMRS